MDSAYLECFENGSSKFYQTRVEVSGDGFIVTYSHGRIGGTPQTGVHKDTRSKPVSYAKAKQVFEKLVASKLDKQYEYVQGSGPIMVGNGNGKTQSGVKPQLLNAIDEDRLEELLHDSSYMMQEKKDGERRMVKKTGDEVIGVNRKGEIVALPEPIVKDIQKIPGNLVLDGELIGSTIWAFDTLVAEEDITQQTAEERYFITVGLVAVCGASVQAVKAAFSLAEKKAMFEFIQANKGEGVVFKFRDAPYVAGKPNSGGTQLKFKFWASATCVVGSVSATKRSVGLVMADSAGVCQSVGRCTIPANHAAPSKGALVEIKYLYAYKGGCLYQPQYLGERTDVNADAIETVKFKAEGAEDDEPQ